MVVPPSVNNLRAIVQEKLQLLQYKSAIFFADKLVSLSRDSQLESDVALLARCFLADNQPLRAINVVNTHFSKNCNVELACITAQCQLSLNQHEECLSTLEKFGESNVTGEKMLSHVILLRAKALLKLDRRGKAKVALESCLKHDIHCYEALELLSECGILTGSEERALGENLKFQTQDLWLQKYYECLMTKNLEPDQVLGNFQLLRNDVGFSNNLDLLAVEARFIFATNPAKSYEMTQKILSIDPLHGGCLPVHLANLVALAKKPELHYIAHRLVKNHPGKAVSWFGVGCYYYLIGKSDQARRYFRKSTGIDSNIAATWVAYGHTFAAEDEGEQALTAYRKAAQLEPGNHLPLVYIGMEYSRLSNLDMAMHSYEQALTIMSNDPLLFHEIGVNSYRNNDFPSALQFFHRSLEIASAESELDESWEPLLINLGHTYRKLRMYTEAVSSYEHGLTLVPDCASTYSALGFTYHLIGDVDRAIELYHSSLSIKSEDTFTAGMLNQALEEQIESLAI